ncbi:MAG: sigma-54 dependent transcriptional regulator [Pseudomonadota bacterium]
MLIRVVVVAESAALRRRLVRLLPAGQTRVVSQLRRRTLWSELSQQSMDLVVIDRASLPEPIPGSVGALRDLPEHPEVVVVSTGEDATTQATLLGAGALSLLSLDLDDDVLGGNLETLVERCRRELLLRPRAERQERTTRLGDFVSASPAMYKLIETARRVTGADTSLLLLGETGVGKERLARAIHAEGPRASGPFVAINCSAIPETLLESELFGHEKGAFTGAMRTRRGHFELAHRGTLFLDELADAPASVQVKLLRVLQERVIQPVGSERAFPVDVRVMAATNRNLRAEVEAQRFRRDLFYRLSVVTLEIPPLRERREDLPMLVTELLEHHARRLGRPVTGIADDAMRLLLAYSFPGNVRELHNVIEHAVLLVTGPTIGLRDLPDVSFSPAVSSERADAPWEHEAWLAQPWPEARQQALEVLETRYFEHLLRDSQGRLNTAAARSGVTSRSLYNLMQRHGWNKEQYRR